MPDEARQIRGDYASALDLSQVRSREDFTQKYLGSLGAGDNKQAHEDMAAELPSHRDVVDLSIGLASQAGKVDVPTAAGLRKQLLDGYAHDGTPPHDMAMQGWTEPPAGNDQAHRLGAGLIDTFGHEVGEHLWRTIAGIDGSAFGRIYHRMFKEAAEPYQAPLEGSEATPGESSLGTLGRVIEKDVDALQRAPSVPLYAAAGLAKGILHELGYNEDVVDKAMRDVVMPGLTMLGAEVPVAVRLAPGEFPKPSLPVAVRDAIADTRGSIPMPEWAVPKPLPPADELATGNGIFRALDQTGRNADARRRQMMRSLLDVPEQWLTKEFQEKAYKSWEEQLKTPDHEHAPDVAQFFEHPVIKDLVNAQNQLFREIRALKDPDAAELLPGSSAGYVHRVAMRDGMFDALPEPGEPNPMTGIARSLRTSASAMNPRDFFVLQEVEPDVQEGSVRLFHGGKMDHPGSMAYVTSNRELAQGYADRPGARMHYMDVPADHPEVIAGAAHGGGLVFQASEELSKGLRPLPEGVRIMTPMRRSQAGFEYGDRTTYNGQEWEVRQPTTEEIEMANPSLTFHKNWLTNTADNVLSLGRALENLQLLDRMKTQLAEKGLIHEVERVIGPGTRQTVAASKVGEGWVPLELPQLRGYEAPKEIAEPINDFAKPGPQGDLGKFLVPINNFLTRSLFITPWFHKMNLAAQWGVNRGFDWFTPATLKIPGYLTRALEAVNDPTHPDMIAALKEGWPIATTAHKPFMETVLKTLFDQEVKARPDAWHEFFQNIGLGSIDNGVRSIYRWSNDDLWRANDVMMLMRRYELQDRGYSPQEAIHIATRDMPTSSVPPRVWDNNAGRIVSRYFGSYGTTQFGPWHYSLLKSLGTMIKDTLAPQLAGDRGRAAGRMAIAGLMGLFGYPALSAGWARLTGDPNTQATPHGVPALVDAAYNLATGQKDWAQATGSLTMIPPAIRGLLMAKSNKDDLGRDILIPHASAAGNAARALEAASSIFPPLQWAIQAAEGQGWNLVGGNTGAFRVPSPGAVWYQGHRDRIERKEARKRDRNDKLLKALKSALPGL